MTAPVLPSLLDATMDKKITETMEKVLAILARGGHLVIARNLGDLLGGEAALNAGAAERSFGVRFVVSPYLPPGTIVAVAPYVPGSHGCTDDHPCLSPVLRWVHSERCRRVTRPPPPPRESAEGRAAPAREAELVEAMEEAIVYIEQGTPKTGAHRLRRALPAPAPAAPPRAAPTCTGRTAVWCPVHGDCRCPRDEAGEVTEMDGAGCPLHAWDSMHGEPSPAPRAPGEESGHA